MDQKKHHARKFSNVWKYSVKWRYILTKLSFISLENLFYIISIKISSKNTCPHSLFEASNQLTNTGMLDTEKRYLPKIRI